MSNDSLKKFREEEKDVFLNILLNKKLVPVQDAEAIVHALYDISESIEEIYNVIIPKILQQENGSRELLQDLLWDIREEYKHIQYHIDDAKLTEL